MQGSCEKAVGTSLKTDVELQSHSWSRNDPDDETVRDRIAVVEEDEAIE